MNRLSHRVIEVNGIDLHCAELGEGPAVLLCHGFPGLWYSWRHQLPALAAEGFRALAPDMRGYGRSSAPAAVDDYSLDRVSDDLIALLDALGEERALLVGHDFGTPTVWRTALRYPERVAGVVATSVPYDFDLYGRGGELNNSRDSRAFASALRPTEAFALAAEQGFLHAHYFQQPGVAEAELDSQPREFLRRLYWTLSAGGDYLQCRQLPSAGHGYLDVLPSEVPALPWPWLNEVELDYFASEYGRGGFRGGLNWYRVADTSWAEGEAWVDARIELPALFLAGAEDPVLKMIPEHAIASMRTRVPGLRGVSLLPGAGHWLQQEQAEAFNRELLDFATALRGEGRFDGVA